MRGHMLPTTVVVLSHIMTICPSIAAPQNMIIPSTPGEITEVEIPTLKYDEMSSSSLWEETSPPTEKGNIDFLRTAYLLSLSPKLRSAEKGMMMLVNNNEGAPRKSPSFLHKDGSKRDGIRHRYEFEPWIVPTGEKSGASGGTVGHGHEVLMEGQDDTGTNGNKKSLDDAVVEGEYWTSPNYRRQLSPSESQQVDDEINANSNSNSDRQHEDRATGRGDKMSMMIPTYIRNRLMKRSPRCLRRCLAQGLLHPSQCHSLC